VLDLIACGFSNSEICKRLVISEATTKTHVAHILHKLDLRDRIQAVIYATRTAWSQTRPATEPAFGERGRQQRRHRLISREAGRSTGWPTTRSAAGRRKRRHHFLTVDRASHDQKEPHVHAPELYFDLPRPPPSARPDRAAPRIAEIADAFFVSFPPGPAVFATLLLAGTLWTTSEGTRGRSSRRAVRIRDRKRPVWPRHGTGDLITTIATASSHRRLLVAASRDLHAKERDEDGGPKSEPKILRPVADAGHSARVREGSRTATARSQPHSAQRRSFRGDA